MKLMTFLMAFFAGMFLFSAFALAQGGQQPDLALPAMIVAVLNFFAPIVIQFLKTKLESRLARFWVSLIISGLTGLIAAIVAGVNANDTIQLVIISFSMAQLAYNSFWKVIWK